MHDTEGGAETPRTAHEGPGVTPWTQREVRVGTATIQVADEVTEDHTPRLRALVRAIVMATAEALGATDDRGIDVTFDDDGDPELTLAADVELPAGLHHPVDTSLRITERPEAVSAVVAVITATPLPTIAMPSGRCDPTATLAELELGATTTALAPPGAP